MGRWGESMRFGGTVDVEGRYIASDTAEGAFAMSRGSGRIRGFLLYVPDLYEGRITGLLWRDTFSIFCCSHPDQFAEDGF
jgi:hypothetical protein